MGATLFINTATALCALRASCYVLQMAKDEKDLFTIKHTHRNTRVQLMYARGCVCVCINSALK